MGYRLRADYDLPPLMFDREEIQALVLGARIVQQFGDAALARAGTRVLGKVAAMLPKELQPVLNATTLFAPRSASFAAAFSDALLQVREALQARRKMRLTYRAQDDQTSERVVRPLGAFFWGRNWTLAAYCELRADFRNFRLDRIATSTLLDDTFADEPGRTLSDMMARYGPDAIKLLSG